jgi:hypothetical protein
MGMTIAEAQTRIQAILSQVEQDQQVVISEINLMQHESRGLDGAPRFVRTVRLTPSPGPGSWAGEG